MFTDKRLRFLAALATASLVFVVASMAWAQVAPPASAPAEAPASESAATGPAPTVSVESLAGRWGEFFHYILLGQADAARSYGEAMIDMSPKPEEVYQLSVGAPNTQKNLDRAITLSPALKPVVEKLRGLIEKGYQAEKANPTNIARSIDMLDQGNQQYEIAAERLRQSGEFALPQLMQRLCAEKTSEDLSQRILNVLGRGRINLGKEAVNGLCAALGTSNPKAQGQLADVLGRIGYKHAAPWLKELSLRKGLLPETRLAVQDALEKLIGKDAAAKSLSELAFDYAQRFYNHDQSLMPDARLPQANVWYWQEGLGLVFVPVPKEIFPDIYAMRLCRMALGNEAKFDAAMGLWLAADIRREAALGAGIDPTVPKDMPASRFFALSSPPEILQNVLARGLKDKDAVVAAGAIEALVRTQGAKSLVQPVAGGAQPLVEAMTFPNRTIRYQAAIALANAMPDRPFNGSDLVLAVLNEALRLNGKKIALVAVSEEKSRNELTDVLRKADYDVVPVAQPGKAVAAAKQAGSIDLVLVEPESASTVLPGLRKEAAYVSVPVVILSDDPKIREKFRGEGLVEFMAAGGKLSDVIEKLVGKATAQEALPPDQANAWILRVCEAARMLSLTNNSVYNLARLRPALVENLSSASADVQVAAAKALAAMSAPEAQQAIAATALKTGLAEKLQIEMLNILTESVRRFGNQIAEPQVQSVYALVSGNASAGIREAAAQAWGSLNLPSEKSKTLILQATAPQAASEPSEK